LEHEPASLGFIFLMACTGGFLLLIHFLREVVVSAFLSGEIPEQLTNPGIARLRDSSLIKIARFVLHHFDFVTDHCDRQISRQPNWLASNEPFHVLASD